MPKYQTGGYDPARGRREPYGSVDALSMVSEVYSRLSCVTTYYFYGQYTVGPKIIIKQIPSNESCPQLAF